MNKLLQRMKSLIASLFILALGFSTFAQENVVNIKDPKAKVILDIISSQLESYKSLEMDFELNIQFPGQTAEIQK